MTGTFLQPYLVTDDFERLDRIAKTLYGTEQNGNVKRLLDANPGLAELLRKPPYLVPFGTKLKVPAGDDTPSETVQRPWQ